MLRSGPGPARGRPDRAPTRNRHKDIGLPSPETLTFHEARSAGFTSNLNLKPGEGVCQKVGELARSKEKGISCIPGSFLPQVPESPPDFSRPQISESRKKRGR